VIVDARPKGVEALVQRLLNAEEAPKREQLIARHTLTPDELREAIPRLVDQAFLLLGVDPLRMERICADAAALAEQIGDEYLLALARHRFGDALRVQGRNAEACICYDEAADVFTHLGRPREAARTRVGWVHATSNLGRPAAALAVARSARRILAAYGDFDRVANLDLNIANIHFEHGHYQHARRSFTSAQLLFERLGDAGRLGAARSRAGHAYSLTRLGRHREALRLLGMVRSVYEEMGEAGGYARVVRSIGLNHMELGHYAAALHAFDEVRPRFRVLGMHSEAVVLANYTAECYLYLNRPADALTVLAEADEDAGPLDSPQDALGRALHRVAAHLLLGDRDAVLAEVNDAERRFPTGAVQHRAWLAAQHAATLVNNGAPEEALASAARAERLARAAGMRRLVAGTRITQGEALLALDRTEDARLTAERARRLARAIDAAPLLYRAHELLGRAAEAMGRPGLARRRYAAAISQLEREQRGVIFEFRDRFAANRGTAFERLASLQLTAGRTADALATAERAKSRALADAIAGSVDLRPRRRGLRRLVRELASAREDYAAAFAHASRQRVAGSAAGQAQTVHHLARLEARVTTLIQRLQLAGAIDDARDLYRATSTAALPTVPSETTLIEYFFSGDDILRFQIDAAGVRGTLLEGALPEVERLLRAFRLNLDTVQRAPPRRHEQLATQARAVLKRLHERLLGDLDGLPAYRSAVIVPHGLLHYLPFHALFDGERYLVERLAVSYAPSAALYQICRSRRAHRSRRGGALVLAYSADGRLPYTAHESEQVAEVIDATVYREAAATRMVLREEGRTARLIHIAAHGQFRHDAPLFSAVELADGPLTAADVFSLDLRAALVSLSACETGRAVLGGGDELVGLTRAFLYAGAAGLVVSQWRVDDAFTASLMARFYTELGRGTGRAEALRRAQVACLSDDVPEFDRVHPFFWAGFQLIGADGPV
jgi:CHAT domain-containing protein